MRELLRKNYSCKRLFHRKVKPRTSRPTSNPNSAKTKNKKKAKQKKNKQSKQTNEPTLNNKDPNKTCNYFDVKISIGNVFCYL